MTLRISTLRTSTLRILPHRISTLRILPHRISTLRITTEEREKDRRNNARQIATWHYSKKKPKKPKKKNESCRNNAQGENSPRRRLGSPWKSASTPPPPNCAPRCAKRNTPSLSKKTARAPFDGRRRSTWGWWRWCSDRGSFWGCY